MNIIASEPLPVTGKGNSGFQGAASRVLRWLLPLALLITALSFHLHSLGGPGLWFDETFSVELARQPLMRVWQAIWGPEPNMALYYLLLHFWLRGTALLGFAPNEFIVRLPSALCVTVSTYVVFRFGWRYLGSVCGTVAALLYLLNYWILTYAQQTRAYALQLLLLCLSWYALTQFYTLAHARKRWLGLYVAATTLAIYAHLFSLLVFAAQITAMVGLLILPGPWQSSARRGWKTAGGALLAVIALSAPILLASRGGAKTGSWLPIPQWHDLFNLLQSITNGDRLLGYLILFVCLAAVALIPLSSLFTRLSHTRRLLPVQWERTMGTILNSQNYLPLLWLLLCWLLIPIVISYILSQGSTRLFSTRYLVVITPALCLLLGLGLVALRSRGMQIILVCQLLYLTFHGSHSYYQNAQIEDWRSPAAWLQQRYQVDDGLICYDNIQGCQTAIGYYLNAYPVSQAHFTDDSPGNLLSWRTDAGFAAGGRSASDALDKVAIATYAAKHPRFFYIVGRVSSTDAAVQVQQVQQWMDSHYRLIGQLESAGHITVRLYATGDKPA